jgi:Tol biopolymer transport system component
MRDIHVIGRDGRTAHWVTDHPADDHRPVWSPDGRHLAFLSTRDGSTALWMVAVSDGQAAADPMRVTDGSQDVVDLSGWTTRGLAYSRHVRTDDVYLVPVNPSSGEPRGSPRLVPYRRTGRNVRPVWSPDGGYLAFISSSPAEPDRRAVVLLSSDGEAREFPIPTSVYGNPLAPSDLRWFGDSSGLGFSGFDSTGERTLFRLTLATGAWTASPLPPWLYPGLEWNADGNRFFFTGLPFEDREAAIVEREAGSDRERVVFAAGRTMDSIHRGLRFSPDRRTLAFRRGGEQQGIWVVDVETGTARSVLYDAESEGVGALTWSPDGRALLVTRTAYPGTERQTTELRLIPIAGGDIRGIPLGAELTRLVSSDRGAGRPMIGSIAWSPDGAHLAFDLRSSHFETWVIEDPLAGAASAEVRR